MPSSTITVWVEAKAMRSDWEWNKGKLCGVTVGRLLKRRPTTSQPDTHMVQVDIEVPWTAFEHKVQVSLA